MIHTKWVVWAAVGLAAGVLGFGCEEPESPQVASTPSVEVYSAWPFDAGEAQRRQADTAERLGVPAKLVLDCGQGVQMTLVLIPPGEFVMGSAASEEGRKDEAQHRVRITRAFYMSATEVTQAQYEAMMVENPSQVVGADRPVERTTWDDAGGAL